MADVSLANLDINFDMNATGNIEFSSLTVSSDTTYSFQSTGGVDIDVLGSGFTYSGNSLQSFAGAVTAIYFDPGNDDDYPFSEIQITNFGGGTPGGLGNTTGTAGFQTENFWRTALSGADNIDFTVADYNINITFAADGVGRSDSTANIYTGANDTLTGGTQGFTSTNSFISGDFTTSGSGRWDGGDDLITVGADTVAGDVLSITSGTFIGGDDIIRPLALNSSSPVLSGDSGQSIGTGGTLIGGDDVVDLRTTVIDPAVTSLLLVGDLASFSTNFSSTVIGGNDTLYGSSLADRIMGDWTTDFGYREGGDDFLFGYGGNDTLEGNGGADYIDGGFGVDTITFSELSTGSEGVTIRLWNGTGQDGDAEGDTYVSIENVEGTSLADAIVGADNVANLLDGNGGDDTLFGLSGNDTIRGGNGADRLDGGAGVDTVDYSDAGGAVTLRLWNQTASGGIADGDVLSGFESAIGGHGDDVFIGSDNVANLLATGDGNDTLFGLSGNDTLRGGNGADEINGGDGSDTVDYSTDSSGVTIRLWNQTAEDGDATGDTIASIENVIGGSGADAIVGSDGVKNKLFGGAGNDTLFGLSDRDTIEGGAGSDVIHGGAGFDYVSYAGSDGAVRVRLWNGTGEEADAAGDTFFEIEGVVGSAFNDTIAGSTANNIIYGGVGNDTLFGNAGNDVFGFGRGYDADRIDDWSSGDNTVQLLGLGAAYNTFAEVIAAATQLGPHTVFDFGQGDTLTILNTTVASFSSSDFLFA